MTTKIRNVATSIVTWLTALSVAVAAIVQQLTDIQPVLTQAAASVVAVYGIVRAVSPAPKAERGLG